MGKIRALTPSHLFHSVQSVKRESSPMIYPLMSTKRQKVSLPPSRLSEGFSSHDQNPKTKEATSV